MWQKLYNQLIEYPIDFISHFGSLLPIFVGLINYRIIAKEHRIGILLFAFYFIKDTYSLWLSLHSTSSLHVQNIQAIIELILIGVLYNASFPTKDKKSLVAVLTCLSIPLLFFFYRHDAVSAEILSIFRIFSITICLVYFNNLIARMVVRDILTYSMFWITSGLLMYTAGTFFIFLFGEYIFSPKEVISDEVFDFFWNVSQLLFTLFCLFFALGLWFSKYDRKNIF
ncbi:hypothetical protein ACFSUS_12440 [Spirosoma soli]|uniref:Uncharacterized protein n=1 Tax=Spirosoma soli TaxID=1770529 RepID=A0ABW5M438_9BACT